MRARRALVLGSIISRRRRLGEEEASVVSTKETGRGTLTIEDITRATMTTIVLQTEMGPSPGILRPSFYEIAPECSQTRDPDECIERNDFPTSEMKRTRKSGMDPCAPPRKRSQDVTLEEELSSGDGAVAQIPPQRMTAEMTSRTNHIHQKTVTEVTEVTEDFLERRVRTRLINEKEEYEKQDSTLTADATPGLRDGLLDIKTLTARCNAAIRMIEERGRVRVSYEHLTEKRVQDHIVQRILQQSAAEPRSGDIALFLPPSMSGKGKRVLLPTHSSNQVVLRARYGLRRDVTDYSVELRSVVLAATHSGDFADGDGDATGADFRPLKASSFPASTDSGSSDDEEEDGLFHLDEEKEERVVDAQFEKRRRSSVTSAEISMIVGADGRRRVASPMAFESSVGKTDVHLSLRRRTPAAQPRGIPVPVIAKSGSRLPPPPPGPPPHASFGEFYVRFQRECPQLERYSIDEAAKAAQEKDRKAALKRKADELRSAVEAAKASLADKEAADDQARKKEELARKQQAQVVAGREEEAASKQAEADSCQELAAQARREWTQLQTVHREQEEKRESDRVKLDESIAVQEQEAAEKQQEYAAQKKRATEAHNIAKIALQLWDLSKRQ